MSNHLHHINYLNKILTNLKRAHSRHLGKAPHKPILLLAVLKGIEDGLITNNKIFISPELISNFRSYWNLLVKTGHTANFSLPFYHLANERSKIWHLQSKMDFEKALTASRSIKSLSTLNHYVEYAYLDEKLYQIWLNPDYREISRLMIIEKYFPDSKMLEYDIPSYLADIEAQIMHDSPEEYTKQIKRLFDQPSETQEEEVFIRDAAFSRQITKLYKNTCAITGMHVEVNENVSMIDACHIIPWKISMDDTVTNGISLCPNMHRAFDRGLITIDENYKVKIIDRFVENYTSYSIHQFEDYEIKLPANNRFWPAQENLDWHRQRFGL